jgi:hypothetical protein
MATFTFPEIVEYTHNEEHAYLSAAVDEQITVDAEVSGSLDFADLFLGAGASKTNLQQDNLATAAKASLANKLDVYLQAQFVAVGLEDDDFPGGTTPTMDNAAGAGRVQTSLATAVAAACAAGGDNLYKLLFAQLVNCGAVITSAGTDVYNFSATKIASFEMIIRVTLETDLVPELPAGTSVRDSSGNTRASIAVGSDITVKSPIRTLRITLTNTSTATAPAPADVAAPTAPTA